MAPTKHFSAWRLNKAELASVDRDMVTWEGSLGAGVSEEEKALQRDEERKRLVRLIQQAKHEQSLQKQQEAGAKNKGKAPAKAKAQAAAGAGAGAGAPPSATPTDTSTCNVDYYELLKQDLAVIAKALGSDLKTVLPTPIAAKVGDQTGIQDWAANSMMHLYSDRLAYFIFP